MSQAGSRPAVGGFEDGAWAYAAAAQRKTISRTVSIYHAGWVGDAYPSRDRGTLWVGSVNIGGRGKRSGPRGCPGRGSDWVQNYSSPPGGGGGGGAGGAPVPVPVPVFPPSVFPVPVPVAVPVPVPLPDRKST